MQLNCDLGENVFNKACSNHNDNTLENVLSTDALIMPFIDQANIACGYHAGDHVSMQKTVLLAKQHNVSVGAHPSYQDRENFGRLSIAYSDKQLIRIIAEQIIALDTICQQHNVPLNYVKPHGALYNDMMKNLHIFSLVCQAITQHSNKLTLMMQALPDTSQYQAIAKQHKLTLWFEAFADRNYQDNGLLVPRTQKDAVISNVDDIVKRCLLLNEHKVIKSIHGKQLTMQVDTLCVHGDNQAAVDIVKAIKHNLQG
jgi:UPF0271 protein